MGTQANWDALCAGTSGIGPITRFDATAFSTRFAGEVKNFDPLQFIEKKELKKMDIFIQFAVAASQYAMDDAKLAIDAALAPRVGVFIGSGIGGFTTIEEQHSAYLEGGPRKISPFFIPSSIINLAAGQVSIRFGAKGPNLATCTACTASAHAIGDSLRDHQARRGRRDDHRRRRSGGVPHGRSADSPRCGRCRSATTSLRTPAGRSTRIATASCSARAPACWCSKSSRWRSAAARTIYAEIVGYGMSGDAYHMTAPSEDGDGAVARHAGGASNRAGIRPDQVDYINAHGTSTPHNDRIETTAIKRTFGEHAYKLAISSTKSMTGHLLGAAGGLEAGITALSVKHQTVAPTINLDAPDEGCDLDYVPNTARTMKIDYALSNSFGFGGTNGALLFKRYEA